MWAETGLAIGASVLAYTFLFYPLILAAWKRRAAPVRKDLQFRAPVTVILAVHNGEDFVRAKLESLLALRYPAELVEILVVSDGSTDGTDRIVESFAGRGVRLLREPRGGKAAAIDAGLRQASGDILFFTDVRQPLDADALSHLVANFADPAVGVVTGELRFLERITQGEERVLGLYWRYELWARKRHSEIDSTFVATGCVYAIRRSLAEPLLTDTLADDAVMPLRAFLRGYRVIFDAQALAFDYRMAEGVEFRRRLRTLAGLWQVSIRMPALFTRANRMRLHFVSHKFLRLVLPWSVALVGVSTLGLPESPLRIGLLAFEGIVALLAAVDMGAPGDSAIKRISSPAHTFMSMNLAALLSLSVFFVPPETLWRTTRVKARR
jgi:cellulose synthase/poly-beta-1,6-N-acetylglucosamine synthase-like glycosyltransferase